MLTLTTGIVCVAAALAGGFIDAISGGGGLLTIPALLFCGIPPHIALGTNKVSACLGTAISLVNFSRHHLVKWRMAFLGIPFSIIGSWLGSLLALYLESEILGKILVGLLPIAMLFTLLPPAKRKYDTGITSGVHFWLMLPLICLSIGCYDGFFGPATGSILILLLHWIMGQDMLHASATAKAFNLASNVSAAISFIWHGAVFWSLGLLMGCAFILGNALGSSVAIQAGNKVVRKFLFVSLLLLLSTLVWQYFIAPHIN